MKKILLICLFSVLSSTTALAQPNTLWTRTFGGSGAEGARSVCQTNDGGYIITGYTYSEGQGKSDVYLIKTDSDGIEEWTSTYGGPGWEYGFSVCQTSDNGYIIAGSTTSLGAGAKDVYLIKTDADGEEIWARAIGGPEVDVGRSVLEVDDGGYLVCGYTHSYSAGEDDVWLIKTNSEGDTLWTRTFGDTRAEMGTSINSTNEGNFIIAGATNSPSLSSANQDVYLINVNPQGDLNWEETHGFPISPDGHPFDWGNSVCQISDGGYVAAGNSNFQYPLGIYLLKTDATGNRIWQQAYKFNFYDYSNSVLEDFDGGYIVCGATKYAADSKNDILVMKTDVDGNVIWTRIMGGADSEWASSICKTAEGDLVIAGHTYSYGAGNSDVWLIKISGILPQFEADPVSGHAPVEVAFSDQSSGNIVSWQWDFDNDGTIDSEEQNPTWTYSTAGYYTVSLQVSNGSNSQTMVREDYIRIFNGQSALEFDEQNGYAHIYSSPSINLTNAVTIEAWINPGAWQDMESIAHKINFALLVSGQGGALHDRSLAIWHSTSGGAPGFVSTPDLSLSLDRWQHVAVTYDGSNSETRMYIDGEEQVLEYFSGLPAGDIADNSAHDLFIGNSSTGTWAFDGIIDEVRLWNLVRNEAEIQTNMNNPLSGDEPGLVGYWPMNEGFNSFIFDMSDNNNNGLLHDVLWAAGYDPLAEGIEDNPNGAENLALVSFLDQNYPNPCFLSASMANSGTTISFQIPAKGKVVFEIYNISGQLVKTLVERSMEAGLHSLSWDGSDKFGELVPSGIYLYSLKTDSFSATKRMVMLK